MNFQQLEYIVAVEQNRHFQKAADACFITQATLSTMIKKLEDELRVVIFDRTKQPVLLTDAGQMVIEHAKIILQQAATIKNIEADMGGELQGDLRIGIIPTLSPFLLPLFLNDFLIRHPKMRIFIKETTTDEILAQMDNGKFDIGIIATPLKGEGFTVRRLFYERFVVYVSKEEKQIMKKFILAEDIDIRRLLLLEEGHCLRSQLINLCELRKKGHAVSNFEFEAGSIDSLIRMVDANNGITILPELSVVNFDIDRLDQIHEFKPPVPVREISLLTTKYFVKKKMKEAFANAIIKAVEKTLPGKLDETNIISIKN